MIGSNYIHFYFISYMITVAIVSVSGKAVFENSDQIDLNQNYDQHQTEAATARSLTDCALICHTLDDCRAVLMNHMTGIYCKNPEKLDTKKIALLEIS